MNGLRRVLEKLDNAVYRLERVLLLVCLVLMTMLVFADVLVRTFTRPVGKTAGIILWLAGDISAETEKLIGSQIGPGVFWAMMLFLSVFAVHASRKMALEKDPSLEPPALARSAMFGVGVFGLMFGAIQALLLMFPISVDGAQKFALGFMVWTGFLGASIAARTKRHIAMDAVKKKLDDDVYPWMSALGGTVTAGFTGYVAFLGYYKTWIEIGEWRDVPGVGVFEAAPMIPTWLVTIAIPIALTTVSLRFLASGFSDLLYGPTLVLPVDEISDEMKKLDEDGDDDGLGPAAINALDYGVAHTGEQGRPVEREEED